MVGTRFWRAPNGLQALRDGVKPIFTPQVNVYIYMIICYEILIGCIPFQLGSNQVKLMCHNYGGNYKR